MKVLRVDAPSALAALDRERFDAIVIPFRFGLDLIRQCAAAQPDARRIVLAAYEDLPDLVRHRGLVSRVLPLTADEARIAKAVNEPDEPSVSRAPALPELDELLRWSALRLAQVKGAMVRPLPPDPRALQLQFVLQPGLQDGIRCSGHAFGSDFASGRTEQGQQLGGTATDVLVRLA